MLTRSTILILIFLNVFFTLFSQSIRLINLNAINREGDFVYLGITNKFLIISSEPVKLAVSPANTGNKIDLIGDTLTIKPLLAGPFEILLKTTTFSHKLNVVAKRLPQISFLISGNIAQPNEYLVIDSILKYGRLTIFNPRALDNDQIKYTIDGYNVHVNDTTYFIKGEFFSAQLISALAGIRGKSELMIDNISFQYPTGTRGAVVGSSKIIFKVQS